MTDNRIISRSKYVVTSVTASSTTDTNLTKRPYTTTPNSHNKRQNASDSFNDTSKSTISHKKSTDDSTPFSNELENMVRLKSEENSRLVQSKFNGNTLNISNTSKNTDETELHNKLSEAMGVEVDISDLYKKIELLNSLRKESHN